MLLLMSIRGKQLERVLDKGKLGTPGRWRCTSTCGDYADSVTNCAVLLLMIHGTSLLFEQQQKYESCYLTSPYHALPHDVL
jgi:hypothetical protein